MSGSTLTKSSGAQSNVITLGAQCSGHSPVQKRSPTIDFYNIFELGARNIAVGSQF